MTVTIGIREVTRQTSKVIHRAAAGETVIITEHDKPIAMLVPLPDTGDPAVNQLIREGKLTPASNPGGLAALLAVQPVRHRGGAADTAEVLSEQREDRL
jgi:prevent-host-death family protein